MARKKRITGEARAKLSSDLKTQYDEGATIRALTEQHGRSYGFVNTLLKEAEVTMRPRGGARRPRPN
ncbi:MULTISPECIES: helix-turn-helix domain-containing protein [Streptomyces]|uniref:helix-turn-helix domain-containing protein n=1 Tax=Streptomyces TaxID=1883 RepID=UPI002F908D81